MCFEERFRWTFVKAIPYKRFPCDCEPPAITFIPCEEDFRPVLPTIEGNVDYLASRGQLTAIDVLSRTSGALLGALSLAFLMGCRVVGPLSIQHGRVDYNGVIQRTNVQQMFVNMIRIAHGEPTAFMDVSEVDAVVLSQASLTGSIGGVGAGLRNSTGETGMVSGL